MKRSPFVFATVLQVCKMSKYNVTYSFVRSTKAKKIGLEAFFLKSEDFPTI